MTQEKPPGAKQSEDRNHSTHEGDEQIPTLQEAVDSIMLTDDETPPSGLHVYGPTSPTRTPSGSDDEEFIHTLPLHQAILDEQQQLNVSALESIVLDGVQTLTPTAQTQDASAAASITLTPAPAATGEPLVHRRENPFLPKHVLDRLNSGRRNLVEEIAQSGAALDASTAILRARADRTHKPAAVADAKVSLNAHTASDKTSRKKQQVLDDLVDEYLPLLASELRRRLKKLLDE